MWPVFPVTTTLLAILAMLAVVLLASRIVQPAWWRSGTFRIGVFAVFGAMLLGIGLWSAGHGVGHIPTVRFGAGLAYVGVLTLLPAAMLLPVSAGIDRIATRKKKDVGLSRRALLGGALPAVAAGAAGSGFVTAQRDPTMPEIRMRFPSLHPDLEGLRILHLSDLHLGADLGLEDLDRALDRAMREGRPDLIVLTGDLADYPPFIEPALARCAKAGARYGVLASLGNHEYLHGIDETRPEYERSPVPLLVSAGRTIRIGRAKLFVGGADDPVHMHGDIASMLAPSIRSALGDAPPDADFRLLLCHRPEGFEPASELGFDLTLSGHTHGGQLGLLGRSLLEKVRPDVHWWGPYMRSGRRRTSRLYTTSGFGHWFPYRFGCPTEMPIVVLEGSDPQRFATGAATATRGS